MNRIARPATSAAAVALALAALLMGCTTAVPDGGSGASGTAPAAPTGSKTPEAGEATAAPVEAVLVVASVDVDGKNVTASGYVQGIVTENGTCVFTFSRNGAGFTVEHEATPDRSTTSCGTVQAPIERFQRGDYAVTVGIDVAGTRHTSPASTVVIP
ncbi:hypothetical protein [Leifsonia sp. 21MFCrub1.1]|uniref:hypothetical protein n=1 Tax=Leifsonia sp. 21MFCrub1.1 TaxID=1798223 RepID=UPI0008928108|nr:hypothetical protein [Leifsonia sp. 21MFCrub1.1]SEB00644.1 hypothetical protein SAMN04515680_2593 [Leifsonia sp. 21MFCrub1.1]